MVIQEVDALGLGAPEEAGLGREGEQHDDDGDRGALQRDFAVTLLVLRQAGFHLEVRSAAQPGHVVERVPRLLDGGGERILAGGYALFAA